MAGALPKKIIPLAVSGVRAIATRGVSGWTGSHSFVVPFMGLLCSGQAAAEPTLPEPELPAAEEELLFGDIPSVFSASKYEQKLTEAPARISVATANEIQRFGYRTLTDILNSLPGIYSTYDRSYTFIGNRGFGIPGDYNTRILLLIDLIDRVEVVRGPASSLYGSNAFFGVINVITKRGRDLQGLEVSAAGSQETYQGRLSYGERFDNGLEILLSASGYDSQGNDSLNYPEFDDPETNNGIAEDANDAGHRSLYAKFSYGEFTLSGVRKRDPHGLLRGHFQRCAYPDLGKSRLPGSQVSAPDGQRGRCHRPPVL